MSDFSGASAANATGYPSVIVYETMSGVIVHIAPLSAFTIQALRQHAEELFPYPDPAPYELPIENAADPSIKLSAGDNPAYQALCAPIDVERTRWIVATSIDLACNYPAFADQVHMLAHFRPQLEKLRAIVSLGEDEWQAVLKHCVFTGLKDRQTVFDLIMQSQKIPLTPGEVVEGIRFFRLAIQKQEP